MTLRETLERIRSQPLLSGDEETAKMKLILPILQALGWDIHGDDVEYEYLIEPKKGTSQKRKGTSQNTTRRADVVLLSRSGRPVAFIEAKAVGKDFTRTDIRQVLRYATDERAGDVSICVLTNGPVWWLYLPPQQTQEGQPSDRKFRELNLLDDTLEYLEDDLRAFLGKEGLIGGKAARQARRVLKASVDADRLGEKLPGIWKALTGQADGDDLNPALLRLITRLVYDLTGLRPSSQQVVEMLKGGALTVPPPSAPPPPSPPPGHRIVELWGERYPVSRAYDIVVEVTKAIHRLQPDDFGRIGEVKGPRLLYFSTSEHEIRYRPKPIGSTGWFMDSNLSYINAEARARAILEHFGYDPDELTVYGPDGSPSRSKPPTEARRRRKAVKPKRRKKGQRLPKPTAFVLWGRKHPVRHFYQILVGVLEAIHRDLLEKGQPERFDDVLDQLGRTYASRTPHGKRKHRQVGETGWFVDTHWTGQNTVKRAKQFLHSFGYDPDDLDVF